MSPQAVATIATRESGSSTHRTATSLTRQPSLSAITRSSVSKNQASSRTRGSTSSTTRREMALNPHCASLTRVDKASFSSRL